MAQIDLPSDLNAEDDDGQNWALLDNAADASRVRVGAHLIAGTERFWSVVRITSVDADGQSTSSNSMIERARSGHEMDFGPRSTRKAPGQCCCRRSRRQH